jgi:hypothetical protein
MRVIEQMQAEQAQNADVRVVLPPREEKPNRVAALFNTLTGRGVDDLESRSASVTTSGCCLRWAKCWLRRSPGDPYAPAPDHLPWQGFGPSCYARPPGPACVREIEHLAQGQVGFAQDPRLLKSCFCQR